MHLTENHFSFQNKMESSTILHQIDDCCSPSQSPSSLPHRPSSPLLEVLDHTHTHLGVTGLSVYVRKIGTMIFSLFFGSKRSISFQALLMDSFITFDFKYSLCHDTTLPYFLFLHGDLWVDQRISELEGTFSSRQEMSLQCHRLKHPASALTPCSEHLNIRQQPFLFIFFHENVFYAGALNIIGTRTLQVGLDHPVRAANKFYNSL